jgi:hypothetical protein
MDECSQNTEIIYIHGLNATGFAMLPFKYYNQKGHAVTYSTFGTTLEQMIDEVDQKIFEIVKTKDIKLILVGWSMGGIISNRLHQKGWNILLGIYVASPLNGAKIFNTIPALFSIHEYLKEKEEEPEPPHNYHTISLGWLNSSFDGAVFKNETIIKEDKHQHIGFTDHRFSAFDPRVLRAVYDKIGEVEDE